MKAMIWTRYGPPEVLSLQDVPRPIPKENELLINIKAATVTAGDCELRRFELPPLFWLPVRLMMGIMKPKIKILGQEMAGEIVEIGAAVKKFKPGDKVYGPPGMKMGGYAQYLVLPETAPLALIPENIGFKEAATLPTGGLNALYFLRKANIQEGESLLIIGAGGSIGTYGLQMAKAKGAEVTVIDRGDKLDMLKAQGAGHCIDFTQEDFAKQARKYDVIFDVAGKNTFREMYSCLTSEGRLLLTHFSLMAVIAQRWTRKADKCVLTGLASESFEDLQELNEMMSSGVLQTVIDKEYPLEQLVEAHTYVEDGHKKGHVIINIPPAENT